MNLCQQLPLDLLQRGRCETHVAGGVSHMRCRAYVRRERDTSAPIVCLLYGPIWSVLLQARVSIPAAASTPPCGG